MAARSSCSQRQVPPPAVLIRMRHRRRVVALRRTTRTRRSRRRLVLAIEHYNRIVRMLQAGEAVKMTVDLAVEYQDADLMGYNTIAEIPGTDLKDEVVMLGGHMDSWHSGTGATDNAAGVAVAMEAVRIIQALGLKPRRTIRVASLEW